MKYIDDVIPDIQQDCDKIAKAFNKSIAQECYEALEQNASDWYVYNKASGVYKRTKQLKDRALIKEEIEDYGYKIGISPEKILTHPWVRGKNVQMGSYEDVKGQNVASKVLEWEEKREGVFNEYKYNIWGETLKYLISKTNFDIKTPKVSLPDEIKNDLLEMMKANFKKQLQDEYKAYNK